VKSGTKRVESLARGLSLLKEVQAHPGASLHELHGRTGLAKATLLRSLRTLEDSGFVARRLADGGYLPAWPAGEASAAAPRWLPLTEAAGPALEALGRAIPWPTDLGVRDGQAMRVLESNRRLSPIRVNRQALGARPHMLWSAMGRAWLAFCPAAEREEVLARLRASRAPEDRAARNRKLIDRLLEDTRMRGYGVRDARYGVLDLGLPRRLSAIAVPVPQGDAVLACLNCVWLVDAMDERQVVDRHMPALLAAAQDIAQRWANRGQSPKAF
jgi:IclR family mhp operon transcriptional activator